jgi:hypothetical protein
MQLVAAQIIIMNFMAMNSIHIVTDRKLWQNSIKPKKSIVWYEHILMPQYGKYREECQNQSEAIYFKNEVGRLRTLKYRHMINKTKVNTCYIWGWKMDSNFIE